MLGATRTAGTSLLETLSDPGHISRRAAPSTRRRGASPSPTSTLRGPAPATSRSTPMRVGSRRLHGPNFDHYFSVVTINDGNLDVDGTDTAVPLKSFCRASQRQLLRSRRSCEPGHRLPWRRPWDGKYVAVGDQEEPISTSSPQWKQWNESRANSARPDRTMSLRFWKQAGKSLRLSPRPGRSLK